MEEELVPVPKEGELVIVDDSVKVITHLKAQRQQLMEAITKVELDLALETAKYFETTQRQNKNRIGF